MKKASKTFIISSLFIILIIGCNKNDDDEIKNHMNIGGIIYELLSGSLENYGQSEDNEYEGYNLDLTLVSKDIHLTTDENGEMEASGTGQAFYFEMFSSSGLFVDNGDYYFTQNIPASVGTFDYADYNANFHGYFEGNDWVEITYGILTVNKTDDEYVIEINCVDENNKSISGYYKGKLQFYDYALE